MLTRTKLSISVAVTLAAAMLVGAILFQAVDRAQREAADNEVHLELMQHLTELRFALVDYLNFGQERSRLQWDSEYRSIGQILAKLESVGIDAELLARVQRNQIAAQSVFERLVTTSTAAGNRQDVGREELRQRLSSQLMGRTQDMTFDALRLSRRSITEVHTALRQVALLAVLITVLGAALVAANWFVVQKTVLQPMQTLESATASIAAGDEAARTGLPSRADEMGSLARSFDIMAESLQYRALQLQEANRNLTSEIAERKQMENELSQSEKRYRTLFNAIDEGFCIIEMIFDENEKPVDYRFLVINPSFEKQTGLIDAQGKRMRELAPEHEQSWFEIYGRIAVTGQSSRFVDRAEQLHRWFDVYAFRFGEPGNRQVAILFSDITKQHEAKDALEKSARALERSNAELEQFAYVASHDLQEPLRMVVGYVQLLQKRLADKLDADTREFMGFAVDGALRMQALIQDILAYSRVSSKGQPLDPVDSGAALKKALDLLASRFTETGAEVDAQSLPIVMADRTQLVQLFQNLISNALKFCKDHAPRVRVEARHEAGWWRFAVTDNGIGIEPEYRGQLFVIFKRLHTRREYPGTGIGLAICKRIVERHGGNIGIESAPGGGSVFWFTLPEEKSI